MKKFNVKIDPCWTLFLDRDGVINKRLIDDYIKTPDEFEFLPGVLESIREFTKIFGKIFVVTNQRGISRQLMTEQDLSIIHNLMLEKIKEAGGRIDKIYFCPHNRDENCGCRKPEIGMALSAKKDFPEIDFKKSIMVGDSLSDIKFGENAGMITVHIAPDENKGLCVPSLKDFAKILKEQSPC